MVRISSLSLFSYICRAIENSKLRTQNSELKTQNSKLITMSTIVEKPKKTTKKPKKTIFVAPIEEAESIEKKSLLDYAKEIVKNPLVYREKIVEDNSTEENVEKKKTLWDVAEDLAKKPLIRVLDEDLVYGSNMMTKLLQEEEL